MRILVLGGSHFIGRAIVEALVGAHDVTVLNRGTRPLGLAGVSEAVADRRDRAQVRAALTGDFDAVVDVSGSEPAMVAAVLPSIASMDLRRYVFISTAAVYDRTHDAPPFVETMRATGDPLWGEYATAKAACERLLTEAVGECLVTLRPPYVFGPRNTIEREQFVWGRLLAGAPIFVPGSGATPVHFSYVKTLAAVAVSACEGELPVGTYNVADDHSCTFEEYVQLLARICGREPDVRHVHDARVPAKEYFPFADADYRLDLSRIRATGLLPERSLEEAMAETYRWFASEGTIADAPTATEASWRARDGRPA